MNGAKTILTISRNPVLQNLRTIILQRAGFEVSAAYNDEEALRFAESSTVFDIVLLCHTVPEASRLALVGRMKRLHPKIPILVLYNGFDPTKAKVDGEIHSLESPEAMINMAKFLTMCDSGIQSS